MKKKAHALIVLWCCSCILLAAPPGSDAQEVAGKRFNVFLYSQFFTEPATTLTFEQNNVLLIESFTGFGAYIAAGPVFTGFFSAPNSYDSTDLFLVLTGAAAGDFLGGAGMAFRSKQFEELFLFSGYASTAAQ